MKDIIRKPKIMSSNRLRKLPINKADIYNKPEITDAFYDFLTNIGQKLASQIPKWSGTFKTYIGSTCFSKIFKRWVYNRFSKQIFHQRCYRPISW